MFNPYLIIGALLAFIAVAVGGFFEGYHYKTLADASATAAAEKAVIVQTETADQITANAVTIATQDQLRIQDFTLTQLVEVPVYVTKISDSRCAVPRGFVRLHDSAAGGMSPVPLGAGQFDDDPSGIALSAVADTVAGNYGQCRQTRQQLIDLQAWIAAQRASLDTFERAQP